MTSGKRKSDFLAEKHKKYAENNGFSLRFPNTLVIYLLLICIRQLQVISLDATISVLDTRINSRVDKMIDRGLRKEIEEFYDLVCLILFSSSIVQYHEVLPSSHGILQSIGLKEFLPYLKLGVEARRAHQGESLFRKGCEDVQTHTRKVILQFLLIIQLSMHDISGRCLIGFTDVKI